MEKFFKILLVVGIILLLDSAYFLVIDNEIVALFTSIFGVLIVGFSVFEIISLKKERKKSEPVPKKKEKPIASKAKKQKLEDATEWASYDVWDERKEERDVKKEDEKIKIKPHKVSLIKRIFFPSKPLKEKPEKKIVEKEVKTKSKKKVFESGDKEAQLRHYIFGSLKKGIPKEKIIEAALASDWPHEVISKIFKEMSGKKKKSKLKLVLALLFVVAGLVGFLFFSDGFLLDYWIESISMSSPIVYGSIIMGLFIVIIIALASFKYSVGKKKKLYKMLKNKKIEEAKEDLDKPKELSEIELSTYKTEIDKLLEMINKRTSMDVSEVAKIFNVTKAEAEEWGKILKDEGLITLYYPTVGDVELRCKKVVKEEE